MKTDEIKTEVIKEYSEFKPLIDEIIANVCDKINTRARKIESEMPYKGRYVLEEVIKRLSELV